jgi:hypothetical protein
LGVLTTSYKLKNMMKYLKIYHLSKWNPQDSLIIQLSWIEMSRALDLQYIGYKNKTQGKGYGIMWGDMRDTLRTCCEPIKTQSEHVENFKSNTRAWTKVGQIHWLIVGHESRPLDNKWEICLNTRRGGVDVWHKQDPLKQKGVLYTLALSLI